MQEPDNSLSRQRVSTSSFFSGKPSFSLGHRLFRMTFQISWILLARWTPPQFHRWRVIVINLFGAHVHATARIYPTCKIWYPPLLSMHAHSVLGPNVTCYCMEHIEIHPYAVISQNCHLCTGTRNIHSADFALSCRPIVIHKHVWIAADAFVGPGVIANEGAVLSARGAAFTDLKAWTVYRGNPAIQTGQRTQFTQ